MKSRQQNDISRCGQQGMSLVELLVALTISLVILGGMYQVFTSSTSSYRANEDFSRLQENARFALEIFGRDIRMATYTGCAQVTGAELDNTIAINYLTNYGTGLEGFNWNGAIDGNDVVVADYTPNFTTATGITLADLVEGSDILTVRGIIGTPLYLDDIMGGTGTPSSTAALDIVDADVAQLAVGDNLMISDCIDAAVFQVTALGAGTTNVTHGVDLGHPFEEGAEINGVATTTYFVGIDPAIGVPSLFRAIDNQPPEELVHGVESMQIRYGIDTDADRQVDSYVTAAVASADWTEVVAVRIALLMRSDDDRKAPVDNNAYDLNGDGDVLDADDYNPATFYPNADDRRRMWRVFKATYALRNRSA